MAEELMKQFNMDMKATHMANGHRLPAYAFSGLLMHGVGLDKFETNSENGWMIKWKGEKTSSSFSVAIMSNETPFWGVAGNEIIESFVK